MAQVQESLTPPEGRGFPGESLAGEKRSTPKWDGGATGEEGSPATRY